MEPRALDHPVGDSWYCLGPVLVLAEFAPRAPLSDHVAVYLGAMATVLLLQTAWVLIRDRFLQKRPVLELPSVLRTGTASR